MGGFGPGLGRVWWIRVSVPGLVATWSPRVSVPVSVGISSNTSWVSTAPSFPAKLTVVPAPKRASTCPDMLVYMGETKPPCQFEESTAKRGLKEGGTGAAAVVFSRWQRAFPVSVRANQPQGFGPSDFLSTTVLLDLIMEAGDGRYKAVAVSGSGDDGGVNSGGSSGCLKK